MLDYYLSRIMLPSRSPSATAAGSVLLLWNLYLSCTSFLSEMALGWSPISKYSHFLAGIFKLWDCCCCSLLSSEFSPLLLTEADSMRMSVRPRMFMSPLCAMADSAIAEVDFLLEGHPSMTSSPHTQMGRGSKKKQIRYRGGKKKIQKHCGRHIWMVP